MKATITLITETTKVQLPECKAESLKNFYKVKTDLTPEEWDSLDRPALAKTEIAERIMKRYAKILLTEDMWGPNHFVVVWENKDGQFTKNSIPYRNLIKVHPEWKPILFPTNPQGPFFNGWIIR